MTTSPRPGAVYLAASSHETTLRAMAERVLAAAPRRPLRIAASFAAAGGPMVERMGHAIGRIFHGAAVERFTVAGEARAMKPRDALTLLHDTDLVFLGGGDPIQGARRLIDAGADGWLRDARARGIPCMGISAGAMMLCAWWAEWPDDPAPEPDAPHDGGTLAPCTGVVPDLVVDCHAEEDHWSELLLVRGMLRERHAGVAEAPPLRFLGLPSGQGVIIASDGSVESLGGAPFRPPL